MTDIGIKLDNTFKQELAELCVSWAPDQVPAPELLVLNDQLAKELGIDPQILRGANLFRPEQDVAVLAPQGIGRATISCAQAYSGHQFGVFTQLGDGRALLLGEVIDRKGNRRDLHLKGSGRTPFARRGDGKATVGPMLREHLMGEAMYHLGIPTTRILSVIETGEKVRRDVLLNGAVACRVASSHIRIGTFQYAAVQELDLVKKLADYTIKRHYPSCIDQKNPYLAFLEKVCDVQARLVADWMSVGFIHGVLNTDNVTISGETIDYGPCAFVDEYDPNTVFSSIDHEGRYAYGNQPTVTEWNLNQLAYSLKELIKDQNAAETVVKSFLTRYNKYWLSRMLSKLGFNPMSIKSTESADKLINNLLNIMNKARLDYTLFFRYLADFLRGDIKKIKTLFNKPESESSSSNITRTASVESELDNWIISWIALLDPTEDKLCIAERMDYTNPVYIPRNFHVENALTAAVAGDMEPYYELLQVLKQPYKGNPTFYKGTDKVADYASQHAAFEKYKYANGVPGSVSNVCYKTFCGT
jgi:serine/tyrosine/threonine adenylyltransferase